MVNLYYILPEKTTVFRKKWGASLQIHWGRFLYNLLILKCYGKIERKVVVFWGVLKEWVFNAVSCFSRSL